MHTRNLAALEAQAAAALAGIKVRVHGEHKSRCERSKRFEPEVSMDTALYRPFVQHYIALSHDLERHLIDRARRRWSCNSTL